jgi:hypothetical protein
LGGTGDSFKGHGYTLYETDPISKVVTPSRPVPLTVTNPELPSPVGSSTDGLMLVIDAGGTQFVRHMRGTGGKPPAWAMLGGSVHAASTQETAIAAQRPERLSTRL